MMLSLAAKSRPCLGLKSKMLVLKLRSLKTLLGHLGVYSFTHVEGVKYKGRSRKAWTEYVKNYLVELIEPCGGCGGVSSAETVKH